MQEPPMQEPLMQDPPDAKPPDEGFPTTASDEPPLARTYDPQGHTVRLRAARLRAARLRAAVVALRPETNVGFGRS
jgi:hypothetical protein